MEESNDWKKYNFIFTDSTGQFDLAKNHKFIAEHKRCIAIDHHVILDEFSTIREFMSKINDYVHDKDTKFFMKKHGLSDMCSWFHYD